MEYVRFYQHICFTELKDCTALSCLSRPHRPNWNPMVLKILNKARGYKLLDLHPLFIKFCGFFESNPAFEKVP